MKTVNDELEGIKPAAAPAPATTPTQPTNGKPPVSSVNEYDVDDDSGAVAKALAASGLPVIKPQQGKYERFALVPGAKVKHAMVHWSAEHKAVRCISTESTQEICCQRLGFAKSRFAVPVFHYVNTEAASGKLPAGVAPQIEVAALRMSKQNFKDIRDSIQEGTKASDYDFKISKSTDGIKFDIKPASAPPKYTQNPESAARAKELAANIKDEHIVAKLGRERSKVELGLLLSGQTGIEDPKLDDFEDDKM